MRLTLSLCLLLTATATACAGPRFRGVADDGSVSRTGFRVYPPKPYLVVTTSAAGTTSDVIMLPDLNDPQYIIPNGNSTWTATLERGMVKYYKESNTSEAVDTITESTAAFAKLLELTRPAPRRETPGGSTRALDSDTPPAAGSEAKNKPPSIKLFEIQFDAAGCMQLVPVPQGECDRLCGRIAQLPAIQTLPR